MPLISESTAIAVYLIVLIGLLYWISEKKLLVGIFKYLPPAIWVYFLPMLSSNVGIIPQADPLYDWIRTYLLPTALVLMLLAANLPALARLGRKAVGTMLVGTAGIFIGVILSYFLLHPWLPPDSWKGVGALTGSWVGGSANMVAVAGSIGTPDSMLGPLIVVDTVVGYGWMGIVIALSVFQIRLDTRNNVDRNIVLQLNAHMHAMDTENRRPLKFTDLVKMLAVGFGVGYAMLQAGKWLPDVGVVLNSFGWAIILASVCGILLSFTRLADLEYAGASTVGSFFFYLLLASIGAKANVQGILDAPLFLLLGVMIIAVHAMALFFAGKLMKSPLFLLATASQANIGGPVTAPIVAAVYQTSLAPVGLLLAVLGNVMGTFVGLTVAQICYFIGG